MVNIIKEIMNKKINNNNYNSNEIKNNENINYFGIKKMLKLTIETIKMNKPWKKNNYKHIKPILMIIIIK